MDAHSPKQRSRNMAAIKGKDTKPEMIVRRMLHGLGYRYGLHGRALPGRPDLVFSARKKVVFVHGCFWHMHDCRWGAVIPKTRTEFWQNKRRSNVERDVRTRDLLREAGWRFLIVWECELKSPQRALKKLVAFLEHRSRPLQGER